MNFEGFEASGNDEKMKIEKSIEVYWNLEFEEKLNGEVFEMIGEILECENDVYRRCGKFIGRIYFVGQEPHRAV